jgi:hypothetical protein
MVVGEDEIGEENFGSVKGRADIYKMATSTENDESTNKGKPKGKVTF